MNKIPFLVAFAEKVVRILRWVHHGYENLCLELQEKFPAASPYWIAANVMHFAFQFEFKDE